MMRYLFSSQKAFTLPEIVIVLGVTSVLFGLISFNLIGAQRQTSLTGTVSTIVADIKQQQLKAMMGDTDKNDDATPHGIYFEEDQYTLFSGSTYDASDPSNFVVELPAGIIFSQISFPDSTLVFSRMSGEVGNYSFSADSITVSSVQGSRARDLRVNRYGGVENN